MTHIEVSGGELAPRFTYVPDEPHPVVAGQQPRAVQPAAQPADAFRNMFAILHNLDRRELEEAGVGKVADWPPDNMSYFVLRLDDARLDALYALITSRQPERYRGIV